jgi:hypothetical protein
MRVLPLFLILSLSSAWCQTAVYPGGTVTDSQLKVQVNGVQTLTTAPLTINASSIPVLSCGAIPNNSLLTIDTEIIAAASCSGTTVTVATTSPGCTSGRGCDNSTAASHLSGAAVYLFVDAWHHNALRVEVEAVETALGTNLANVITASKLVLGGSIITYTGGFNATFALPASGTWTYPAAGTLIGSADNGTVTNTMLNASAYNPKTPGTTTFGTPALPYAGLYLGNGANIGTLLASNGTAGRTAAFPDANITVSGATATDCGTSAGACAGTSTSATVKIVTGTATASSGSPSTVAITGMPAFTSSATYKCFAEDATTVANNFAVLTAGYSSATAVTFTGPNTVTDVIRWACIGY